MKYKSDASLEPQSSNYFTGPDPTKVGNRFVGKCYAGSGEPVYLTMQEISPENQAYWQQYVKASKSLAGYNSKLLVYLAERTVKVELPGVPAHYKFSKKYTEDLARQTGYTETEFNEFINFLGHRGFNASEKQKIYALAGNAEGSEQISLKPGHYIIYASKIEAFSIEHIELLPENSTMTLKAFRQNYSDLLMCVSSWNSAFNSLQNRGIFKNPGCAVLDGGYRDISLLMHGFIAAVALIFLNKENITVLPVSSMQHIILKAIPEKDISFTSDEPEAEYTRAKEMSENFRSSTKVHQMNIIKATALAQLYYKNSVVPMKPIKHENTFFSSICSQQTETDSAHTNDSGCCIIF